MASTASAKELPPPPPVSDVDIGKALLYETAAAFSEAASGSAFNSDATVQAARAHKHTSFAKLLEMHAESHAKLTQSLAAAAKILKEHLAGNARALRLIARLDAASTPVLEGGFPSHCHGLADANALPRQRLSTGRAEIRSKQSVLIFGSWLAAHGPAHAARAVVQAIPATNREDIVIKALAGALNDQDGLPRMHAQLRGLLRFVRELPAPPVSVPEESSREPRAKRARYARA